jgi:hypothetical protein
LRVCEPGFEPERERHRRRDDDSPSLELAENGTLRRRARSTRHLRQPPQRKPAQHHRERTGSAKCKRRQQDEALAQHP